MFCNNRLVEYSDKIRGEAGFRLKRSCVDCKLNELVQGRMKEGKKTFAFFLDVQKAYDTVWLNCLWFNCGSMVCRGRC